LVSSDYSPKQGDVRNSNILPVFVAWASLIWTEKIISSATERHHLLLVMSRDVHIVRL
jgi:hypothetical protein